jgi:hypothetical protein
MIAADFAGFRAERTGHVAIAWSFAAMTAGRVRSSTLGVANSVCRLNNHIVNPGIVIFASMRAVVSTSPLPQNPTLDQVNRQINFTTAFINDLPRPSSHYKVVSHSVNPSIS